MVEKVSQRSELLSAVFNNVPELVDYYPRITSLIPYTDDTYIWVIGKPGSTKTSLALALADRLKNGIGIKGKKPNVWLVDFDRHLAFLEDKTGWSRRNPEHAGLLLPFASFSVQTSLWWIRENSDKPNTTVIDLPVIPHRRDNGRNTMHQAIYDTRDQAGQIHRIIPVRPDQDLLKQILTGRMKRDQNQLYSRNTASADVTEKAYLDEMDLIDDLIEKGELPEDLEGFRQDPEKADKALEATHILECRKALGVTRLQHKVNSEEFYRTARIAPLPPDIAAQLDDDTLEQWVHEYYLPLDQILEGLTGPSAINAFRAYTKRPPLNQRIDFPFSEPLSANEAPYIKLRSHLRAKPPEK